MTPSEQMRRISQIALLKAASKELHKVIDKIIVELREREEEVVENCSDDNLKALCQRCHNQYDAEHRKQTRKGNSAENNK